jgi:selenocysteine-specific elongation factor
VIALTKADVVDTETLELARHQHHDHLAGAPIAPAPVVVVGSLTGRGLDELVTVLDGVLANAPGPVDKGRPRLWVDRVFAPKGSGTVVTGTLVGGSLAVDDDVIVQPHDRAARVRGIESAHERVDRVAAGSRVALNLAGVDRDAVTRGDAIVLPGQWAPVTYADVALTALPATSLPKRGTLHAYVGSGEHVARFRVLDGDSRFGRLTFDAPLPLAPGDRLVLRSSARRVTVGGAEVLDIEPARATARAVGRLARPLPERLLDAHPWITEDDLVTRAGVDRTGAHELAREMVDSGSAVRVGDWIVDARTLAAVRDEVRRRVLDHHAAHPLDSGAELAALASRLGLDGPRLRAGIDGEADLVVEQGTIRHRDHAVSARDDAAAQAWLDALAASPFAPPTPGEHGLDAGVVRALARDGRIEEIDGVWFDAAALDRARELVGRAVVERGSLTVGDIRDLLGSTRKYVLPLVRHLDSTGVTRRRGDLRIPGPRAHRPSGP